MSFVELAGIVLGAAGRFASILGAFLIYASRQNGEATGDLIRTMEERMTRHITQVLERMDQRADDRHREMAEWIRTTRT